MNQLPHYVGLTGVQSPEEADQALSIFHHYGFRPGASHDNMIGVLVSPATIDNGAPMHSNKPWRQVQDYRTLVETLLRVQGNGVSMIHMELHKQWPGMDGDASAAIDLLSALGKAGVQASIQLNGIVSPDGVRKIYECTGAPIVLQLRKEFMERGEEAVVAYVESIKNAVSKILIDSSAGMGEQFVPATAVGWQRLIQSRLPGAQCTFGYAGGLHAGNATEKTKELLIELGHREFSLDTESGVHAPTEHPVFDRLDLAPGGAFEHCIAGVVHGLGFGRISS